MTCCAACAIGKNLNILRMSSISGSNAMQRRNGRPKWGIIEGAEPARMLEDACKPYFSSSQLLTFKPRHSYSEMEPPVRDSEDVALASPPLGM